MTYDEVFYIRKSPAILVMKIATVEIATELFYALMHFALYDIVPQTGHDFAILSVLLNIGMSFIAIILFIFITAGWAAEGILITKNELIYKYGFMGERRIAYPYTNMQRVEVRQGVVGKLLNFGTVTVHLPVLSEDVHFSDISSPYDFAERLKGSIIRPSRSQYLIKR